MSVSPKSYPHQIPEEDSIREYDSIPRDNGRYPNKDGSNVSFGEFTSKLSPQRESESEEQFNAQMYDSQYGNSENQKSNRSAIVSSGSKSIIKKIFNLSQTPSTKNLKIRETGTGSTRADYSMSMKKTNYSLFTDRSLSYTPVHTNRKETKRKLSTSTSRKMMISFGQEIEIERPSTASVYSENVARELYERKEMYHLAKQQGKERLKNNIVKQQLDRDCKALENRINRMKLEHENMVKRLAQGQKTIEKTVEVKKRRYDALASARQQSMERAQSIEKLKNIHIQEKRERQEGIKKSQEYLKLSKSNKALELKLDLKKMTTQKEIEVLDEKQAKYNKARKLASSEKKMKEEKTLVKSVSKDKFSKTHVNFIEEEKRKRIELESKINDLMRLEGALIEKLKSTQKVCRVVNEKINQVANLKVDPNEPFELN